MVFICGNKRSSFEALITSPWSQGLFPNTFPVPAAQEPNFLPGESHSIPKSLLGLQLEAHLDFWDQIAQEFWGGEKSHWGWEKQTLDTLQAPPTLCNFFFLWLFPWFSFRNSILDQRNSLLVQHPVLELSAQALQEATRDFAENHLAQMDL